MINVEEYEIFEGINGEDNRKTLLDCIHAKEESFKRGDTLDPAAFKGRTALVLDDNCTVSCSSGETVSFAKGQLIGEKYNPLPDNGKVEAAADFRLFFMDNTGFETPCWFSCFFHAKFIDNMEKAAAK